MSETRARLQQQHAAQSHVWGHIQVDRWQAVMQYATGTILDVGCANGVYVKRLLDAGRDAFGVDLLEFPGWDALSGRILMGNATALPVRDDAFDTIISFETLEHVPDPAAALREYRRVAKRIIISVPNCETPAGLREGGLTFHHWIDRTHVNFFTLDTLRDFVSEHGFTVQHAAHINRISPAVPPLCGFGVPVRFAKKVGKVIRNLTPKQYAMTLLLVADRA